MDERYFRNPTLSEMRYFRDTREDQRLRDAIRAGNRISVRLAYKKKAKVVGYRGFLGPPIYREFEEIDAEEIDDPDRSDLPMMRKAQAMGLVERLEDHNGLDYWQLNWRVTEKGRVWAAFP